MTWGCFWNLMSGGQEVTGHLITHRTDLYNQELSGSKSQLGHGWETLVYLLSKVQIPDLTWPRLFHWPFYLVNAACLCAPHVPFTLLNIPRLSLTPNLCSCYFSISILSYHPAFMINSVSFSPKLSSRHSSIHWFFTTQKLIFNHSISPCFSNSYGYLSKQIENSYNKIFGPLTPGGFLGIMNPLKWNAFILIYFFL
jgi:hypothetical protein